MSWKYIVMKMGNQELPIIFPGKFVHVHVAAAIKMMIAAGTEKVVGSVLSREALDAALESVKAVSAGQIEQLEVGGVTGCSETLNLSARPGDEALINSHPYTHGYTDN